MDEYASERIEADKLEKARAKLDAMRKELIESY